jgi:hypothetical protein
MKTKRQSKKEITNSSELQSRSEQLSGNGNSQPPTISQQQTAPAPAALAPEQTLSPNTPSLHNSTTPTPPKAARPYVNFSERERNRQLPVEKVLAVLKRWMPRQYELAEVVGKWIWITFPEQPIERVRADLSQLGFHWNNTRKCWQHPCGETLPRGQQEPRQKYSSYHPADVAAYDASNPHRYNGPARTAEEVAA